jgi:hypothetical protein
MRFSAAEYAQALNFQVNDLQKKAIYGWPKKKLGSRQLDDVTVTTLTDFVRKVNATLKERIGENIPEKYPLLNAMLWSLEAEAKP